MRVGMKSRQQACWKGGICAYCLFKELYEYNVEHDRNIGVCVAKNHAML